MRYKLSQICIHYQRTLPSDLCILHYAQVVVPSIDALRQAHLLPLREVMLQLSWDQAFLQAHVREIL